VVFRVGSAVLPPLGGDAAGPVGDTTVRRLQRQPVSPAAPTAGGQVLTWNGDAGHWEPAAPAAAAGPAAGDVTGRLDELVITRLQTGEVARNVAPQRGQYLFFDGDRWVPGFGVQAPGGIYQIVAAGYFEVPAVPGPATPIGEVYNSTRVQVSMPVTRGRTVNLLVAFGRGRVPTDGVTYVVKGTASNARSLAAVPLVFQSVSRNGVLLAASLANTNLEQIDRVMVEINRIG
jgi:hypothetical protein